MVKQDAKIAVEKLGSIKESGPSGDGCSTVSGLQNLFNKVSDSYNQCETFLFTIFHNFSLQCDLVL